LGKRCCEIKKEKDEESGLMARVSFEGWRKDNLAHLEIEGGIVNIRDGLTDNKGRKVTSIEILPSDHYSGEQRWKLDGSYNNRLIQLKEVV
jgi:hypothetical protein